MKSIKNYINESQDKYFSKQEIKKIKKDIADMVGHTELILKQTVEARWHLMSDFFVANLVPLRAEPSESASA